MSELDWWRMFVHPYRGIKKAESTHGHLKPTKIKVPPYSGFAVPFAWMLRSEQRAIESKLPSPAAR